MENFKIIIFILAVLISLSAAIDKLKLPNPVFLVLVGLIIGFIPVLPGLVMDPDIVFVVFLPPLIYDAAFRTSWHDFKTNIRPISALGISLVFFTTIAVAVTAHYLIPVFSWPLAFLLGAIYELDRYGHANEVTGPFGRCVMENQGEADPQRGYYRARPFKHLQGVAHEAVRHRDPFSFERRCLRRSGRQLLDGSPDHDQRRCSAVPGLYPEE